VPFFLRVTCNVDEHRLGLQPYVSIDITEAISVNINDLQESSDQGEEERQESQDIKDQGRIPRWIRDFTNLPP
jgi:hypothetical protein